MSQESEGYALHSAFQSKIMEERLHYSSIMQLDEGKALETQFRNDPLLAKLEKKSLSSHNGSIGLPFFYLVPWYYWCVEKFGASIANMHLEKLRRQEPRTLMMTQWIFGVTLAEKFDLGDGYVVKPIGEMPHSDEKECFEINFFVHPMIQISQPRAAIIKVVDVPLLLPEKGNPHLNTVWEKLHQISLLMNILPEVTVLNSFETAYVVPDSAPLGMFGGNSGGWEMKDVSMFKSVNLTPDILTPLPNLISAFSKLPTKEQKIIEIVLTRLSQAKRRTQLEDKILDIGLALEILLLNENTKDLQLAISFRLRGAWLLGKNRGEREQIYEQLKEVYNARSSVAHSGCLPQKNSQQISEHINTYIELAERMIVKVIENGWPKWDSLMLGE